MMQGLYIKYWKMTLDLFIKHWTKSEIIYIDKNIRDCMVG